MREKSYNTLSIFFLFLWVTSTLWSQNTYFGPNSPPPPGSPHLIRIQVLLRDSPDPGGPTIQSASFNGKTLPIKPPDIYGNRGGSSFQLPAGKYQLTWVVQRDKTVWPRTVRHEETVYLDPNDFWIQIVITGDEAVIN